MRHVLLGLGLVGLLVAALLVVLPPTVIGGSREVRAPAVPTVTETAATMLRVTWRPVRLADSYEVTVTRGSKTQTVSAQGTEAQIAHLTPGTAYDVRVRAVDRRRDGTTRSDRSAAATARTKPPADPALLVPSGADVAKSRNTSFDLAWETVKTASGYTVQWSRDESFKDARTVDTRERTLTVDGLDAAQSFFVRIRTDGPKDTRSTWSPVLRAKTIQPEEPQDLAVAGYNIRCHSCGGPAWSRRRDAVADAITSHHLDVVGLQEAQQSRPRGVGVSQFNDLVRELAERQKGWKIADGRINGSLGTRVAYNSNALRLVKAGSVHYRTQRSGGRYQQRYYSWAVFTQRSSGRDFLFVSTHLEPRSLPARTAQARQLATDVRRLRGSLPAIVVGDLNASQYHAYSIHRALTDSGLVDPLGILPSSHRVAKGAPAEHRINTRFDSYNGFSSRPRGGVAASLNGTYLDYIFTTPMRVREYENVINVDASGRFRDGPPSDHNMQRAVVGLP